MISGISKVVVPVDDQERLCTKSPIASRYGT
jgi:hypothetical protein